MTDPTCFCRAAGDYCQRCDLLLGLPGIHVIDVTRDEVGLLVEVESAVPPVMGCPACGVIVHAHGRQRVELIDAPCFAAPVRLLWRKRRWVCPEPMCPVTSFMEQNSAIAPRRGLLTVRATRWAIGQMRRENASVQGLARQLGCTWKTLWRAIRPVLESAAADESRFIGVTSLGVDEHSGTMSRLSRSPFEYQRHWGPLIVWLGASGVMSGSWVWGPGVACLGATWGS